MFFEAAAASIAQYPPSGAGILSGIISSPTSSNSTPKTAPMLSPRGSCRSPPQNIFSANATNPVTFASNTGTTVPSAAMAPMPSAHVKMEPVAMHTPPAPCPIRLPEPIPHMAIPFVTSACGGVNLSSAPAGLSSFPAPSSYLSPSLLAPRPICTSSRPTPVSMALLSQLGISASVAASMGLAPTTVPIFGNPAPLPLSLAPIHRVLPTSTDELINQLLMKEKLAMNATGQKQSLTSSLLSVLAPPPIHIPEVGFYYPVGPDGIGPDGKRYIGAYSPEARKKRIDRYLEKRERRVWAKKVKYDVRKVRIPIDMHARSHAYICHDYFGDEYR